MARSKHLSYDIHPSLRALQVSERARRLASLIMNGATLPSVQDAAGLLSCRENEISSSYKELSDCNFVESRKLGCERGLVSRMWLSNHLWQKVGDCPPPMHSEWALARALERLPVREHTYPALANVEGLGRFISMEWHQGLSFDSVAIFERGWLVTIFSGMLESEADLRQWPGHFLEDVLQWEWGPVQAWPTTILWVIRDRWQIQLVRRACKIVEDRLAFYCAEDRTSIAASNPEPGRGQIICYSPPMDMGKWPFEQRLRDSQWCIRDGSVLAKVLYSVIRFPGAWFSLIKADAHIKDSKRIKKALRKLTKLEWINRRKYRGRWRYSVASRGYHHVARIEGTSNTRWRERSRVPAFDGRPRHQDHEDGTVSLLQEFMEDGLKVEPGWRALQDLIGGGRIAPDGLVYLTRGPYGPGWCYVEYERSARYQGRAARKLRGYVSAGRRDRFPVLFVLWNDHAETVFHTFGRQHGLRMVTTTIARLRRYGAVGVPGCWSRYGEDVVIGTPAEFNTAASC